MNGLTILTTGQKYIWAVFDYDGFECKTLVYLSSTAEQAERFREQYWQQNHADMSAEMTKRYGCYHGRVEVEMTEVDAVLPTALEAKSA